MRKNLSQLAKDASAALGIEIGVAGTRAHHYADETREGYWLSREDLIYATQVDGDYSLWCAGSGAPMSARSLRRLYGG